jgi:putative colanic acid biosynthesis UDP-glucose lipid carrier transferase
MFRLEKVFQKDDSFFLTLFSISKYTAIYFSFYLAIVLRENSIYELLNVEIFTHSNFFVFTNCFLVGYFVINFLLDKEKNYNDSITNFLKLESIRLTILILPILIFFYISNNFLDAHMYTGILIVLIVNLLIIKFLFNQYYSYLIDRNHIQRNILLFGYIDELTKLQKNFKDKKINIFKCIMAADINNEPFNKLKSKIPVINPNHHDLLEIISYNEIAEVWILADLLTNNQVREAINKFSKMPVNFHVLSSRKILNMNKPLTIYQNYFCYEINISRFYGNALFIKLLLDKIFSVLFLIILAPVLLIGMLAIYLEDNNPIFFFQERTGWDGRRFKVYKLRTLKKHNPDKTKQVTANDPRLLNCGSFIRRFSIDEIPQFFNVLKGQMSIVGPRPHMTSHNYKYSKLLDRFLVRHACNPGITGLAQISGFRGATINVEDMEKRVILDIEYLEKWSLWLDLKIIFKTFYAVFKFSKF